MQPQVDTVKEQIGQDSVLKLNETVAQFDGVVAPQKVDGPEWKNKAAILAFMEEPVTILIYESMDRNAGDWCEFSNDGRRVIIQRGVPTTIKRKFLEVIARCKQTGIGQRAIRGDYGVEGYEYPEHTSLKYPFQLIEDKNPKGAAWLKKILAEK